MASERDLVAIKEAAEPHLFSLPNVNLVGIGTKVKAGQDTGLVAIVVFVAVKQRPEELAAGETIPTEIGGVPTDVVEIGRFVPLTQLPDEELVGDLKAYSPRLGGARIGWTQEDQPTGLVVLTPHAGTLGCVVRTQDANPLDVILTNKHVVAVTESETDVTAKGREIGQPDTQPCSWCSPCCNHIIGRVLRTVYSPDVDGALVALAPGTKWSPEVISLGPITGMRDISYDTLGDTQSKALKGLPVHKRGMKTEVTDGTIFANNINGPFPSPPDPPTRMLHNQIMVQPSSPSGVIQPFSRRGDSGSVVLDDQRRVLGLLFSGSNKKNPSDPGYGFALFCPIRPVLKELGIQVVTATTANQVMQAPAYNYRDVPVAHAILYSPLITTPAVDMSSRDAIRSVYEDLVETDTGKLYADLAENHFEEVRNLINTNRRVAATWHRNGGPALLHQVMSAIQARDVLLPPELNSRPIQESLDRILQVFRRFGNSALVSDIDRHGWLLMELIGVSYPDLLSRLRSNML
jgi:hypothetical protein